MLKYIVIELCNTSTSYCHYKNKCKVPELISIDNLKGAIVFAMKHNLNIQFVYPDYEIPAEYSEAIESIDHVKIMPSNAHGVDYADVVVFDGVQSIEGSVWRKDCVYILRIEKSELDEIPNLFNKIREKITRLNVIFTDLDSFTAHDLNQYKNVLSNLESSVINILAENRDVQINLLSDRIVLDKMNNCNAGYEMIAVAPNGKFYVCPAFYHDSAENDCGNLRDGLLIKNPQLYRLDHAPICRRCDAYQCKRCVWLNKKTTLEVNTPSHEQCVISHLERNASRSVLVALKNGKYEVKVDIPVIDYLDPFDKMSDWK